MNNNRIAGKLAYASVITVFLLVLFNIRSQVVRSREELNRSLNDLQTILLAKEANSLENYTNEPIIKSASLQTDVTNFSLLSTSHSYITSNFHGIVAGGGLGNQLFELMSLLGMAYSTGRKPWFRPQVAELSTVLHQSIAPRFPIILKQFEFYMDTPSFKYFSDIRPLVRSLLLPSKLVQIRARNLLPPKNRRDFKICVHIRRGDFISDGLHMPSDPTFTKEAASYLVGKYNSEVKRNISLIVLGNDPVWGNLLFMDLLGANRTASNVNIFVQPMVEPEMDIAFSRIYCDVTLATAPSSTFAFWLSYLAKDGAVSYYRDIKETYDKVIHEMVADDFYPPEWIKLRTNSNGEIYEDGQNVL